MSKNACGPQTELMTNPAVRVTRCTCGTVHVTIHASGVTVRLSTENAKALTAGLGAAVERLDESLGLGGATIN